VEFSAAAATLGFLSSFIQCYYYTHTKDSCGKECAKAGIRKRSEIAIFKTMGFEQVPII
jgi:hypothetical protein